MEKNMNIFIWKIKHKNIYHIIIYFYFYNKIKKVEVVCILLIVYIPQASLVCDVWRYTSTIFKIVSILI